MGYTKVMTSVEFANKAIDIAKNYKTLYVMGCFGAPMNAKNKKRYSANNAYNKKPERVAMIKEATADTFGFDCVCLIKGILWGWYGDKNRTYGGASYDSNGVPDIGADSMISLCSEVSTKFDNIDVGEAVWTTGHIGIYVGDGLVVECTPKWENKVQITACNVAKKGYNMRTWKKHGKLPFISYVSVPVAKPKKWTPAVGDVVNYTGSVHYTSANAETAKKCKGGLATITKIYKIDKSKHPYHLVRVTNGGATVYGWVDAGSFKKA